MTVPERGVFVVGTDTGAGKTTIAASLAWALRQRGVDVGIMKPVETGVRSVADSDAEQLRMAAGVDDAIDDISPYRLRAPLAPLVAARRAHIRVSLPKIGRCYDRLARRHDVLIVEGAGGLLVPLTATLTTLDLALMFGLPFVLVIGNRLGAINHALLTVHAIRARGLRLMGCVVNHPGPERDAAVRSNPGVLRELIDVARWSVVPYAVRRDRMLELTAGRLERSGFLTDLSNRITR